MLFMKKIWLISLFLISCTTVDKPFDFDVVKTCSTDNECIVVTQACCGCSNGGSNTSINSKYKSDWTELYTRVCKVISCSTEISNDKTCNSKPICLNGVCTMKSI